MCIFVFSIQKYFLKAFNLNTKVYAANATGSPPPVSDPISEIEKGKSGMKESVLNGDSSLDRTGFGRMPSNVSYFLAILLWIFASRVLAIRVCTRFVSTILFPTFQVVCYGSLITHDIYAGVATNLY